MTAHTKHTPGPWKVQPLNELTDSFHVTTADPDFTIAEVLPYHEREDGTAWAEADARLIAAAPEMLDELRALARGFESAEENGDGEASVPARYPVGQVDRVLQLLSRLKA